MIEEIGQIWKFSNHALYVGRSISIDWETFLFEKIESRYYRQTFKKSAQEFLRAVDQRTEALAGVSSPLSMANVARFLRRLVRWMIENDIYRFSELEAHHLILFVKNRPDSKKNVLTEGYLRAHIRIFEKLWELRSLYPASLQINPFTISELRSLQRFSVKAKRWIPVPQEIAVSLLRDAIDWIENDAPHTINLIKDHDCLRGNLRGLTKAEMRTRSNAAYNAIQKNPEFSSLHRRLSNKSEIIDSQELLRRAVRISLGAAAILILFFSGVRCSELLSLELDCCTERRHSDGELYWYMEGIAAKKGGIRKEWVVPLPVVKAIRFLEKLHAAAIPEIENSFLFAIPNGNGILPPPYVTVRRLWSSGISDLIKLFAGAGFRLHPVKKNMRLHPHQARKTFAKFVVLRDRRGLEALAPHYGHIYTAILDGAYVGSDISLHHLLNEESELELTRGLTDLLTAKSLGGKAGEMLSIVRNEVSQKFRGKRALNSIVKKLIRDGITLAPCDWGYCVYAQDLSACGGDERGPSLIDREPNICASCGNFAVTEKHRSWWEERAVREEKFIKQDGLSIQTITVVKNRASNTQDVLEKLNRSKSNVVKK
ncbi:MULTISPECIES: site-specific integrase [unclassified Herbaspirillum]|uniref:site-specific integrase n=1 Tax=unclassified Herbaspirillum TaxID=2624150 RepID=UPI0010729CB8|nr:MULTISPECIES: site-specific integrase [unclassified Herbaspirillum]TFI05129.1 site-specific integrase [Herbaspirillum sp. 3R11]TFI12541.1 site-specific integrase [Herbaspirillum sp. 3R-11]TFI26385.1 site-specific integrase [Herbaspirillum sp. 3C11]